MIRVATRLLVAGFVLCLGLCTGAATSVRTDYSVPTIADLQALNPRSVSTGGRVTVSVLGRATAGDIGMRRSFTSHTTAAVTNATDGVHYVSSGAVDLVWVSSDRDSPIQHASWWGALGGDGNGDASAVQATINYVAARAATWDGVTNAITGQIVLPPGNLDFETAVLVDRPVDVRGAGRESTIITCVGTNNGFHVEIPYFAGQYSFAYLHDFSLYKSLDNRTGSGIYQGATGSQIIAERINVTGFANGLTVNGWASSFRDIVIQEAGANSVHVPSSVAFGYNQTSSQFERVLAKNGAGHGFNIENSSYFSFFSCYAEKHTNGVGWRIVTTPDRGVAGNNYAIQMENCASEFDLVALEASNVSSLRWTGGMFIPRPETTNVVRFIGPVQAKLDGVEVVLPYTPSQAGYTVWTEDSGYGWPHSVEIIGGQWRRLLGGLENRPGTVKWKDAFTNPSPSRDLEIGSPGAAQGATNSSIAFNLTGHEIGTNAFTLYLDATWPDYNQASSETVVHTSTSQTIWANTNAFFLAQFNDAKFGAGSYNPDVANSLSLRATNALAAFSGTRNRILFSRSPDGARLWVDGKRLALEPTVSGSGGSIATNSVSGPWLHFGSLLGSTRWRYHGGGLLNFGVTDDAQAYRITLRGPAAELPWASFGTGTNGIILAWRIAPNGDFRDAGPLRLPAYQIGSVQLSGLGDDLWTSYGRRDFTVTNASASSQFRQTYGTVLPGYAEVANAYGGLLLADSTNNATQKAARFGMPNYQSDTIAPLGLVGGLSYSGGGDVNFGGYGSGLFSKASQYLWAYGSTNSDTTGWLGMYASRGNGLHVVNPATIRLGTNTAIGSHAALAYLETGRFQIISPTNVEIWAGSADREINITSSGLIIESGKTVTFGGVTRSNWPTSGSGTIAQIKTTNSPAVLNLENGFTIEWNPSTTNWIPDIIFGTVTTNHLDAFTLSYLLDRGSHTGTQTLSTISDAGAFAAEDYPPNDGQVYGIQNSAWVPVTGGSGPTNGTALSVDGGSAMATANLQDGSRIGFGASGANITADIVAGSVRTNELATAAISHLLGRANHTGTQPISTLSDAGDLAGVDWPPSDGNEYVAKNGAWAVATGSSGGGTGSVTSVALTMPAGFSVSGSPVTSSGTLAVTGTLATSAGGTGITTTTSAGQALLAAANAAAQRNELGLGALATLNDAPTNGSPYVRSNGVWAIAMPDGSPSIWVEGSEVIEPNLAESPEVQWDVTGTTNIAPSIKTGSLATNKIDATFRSWVESMSTGGVVSSNVPVALTLLTSTGSVTNTTTNEVSLISTVTGNSVTNLDANTLASGATLRLRASGVFTSSGNYPDARFRFKVGGYTALVEFDEPSSWNPTDTAWALDAYVTVVTAGSSATVRSFGTLTYQSASNADANEVGVRTVTGSGTLNTTSTVALDLTWESDPGATMTVICHGVTIERIGQNITVAAVGSTNLASVASPGWAPTATLPNAVLGTDASTNVGWTVAPVRTKTLATFRSYQGEQPTNDWARMSTVVGIGVMLYDHTTQQALRFRWCVPEGYTNTVADVILGWTTTATSGNGRWGARNMRMTGVVSSDSFGTAVEATTTTSGTARTKMVTTLEDVDLDGAVAGDWVWTEVYRDTGDAADTIDAAQLELQELEVRAP